ncbi:MAG: hypothetical protein A2042_01310 [Candidatus Schekmanbacteria bacterium GWA2_38_11]|uniref:Enoyl reductase (ER) domain-containing protein n=1 Tax=Candidatus Schekmanbacteria bacterium GWA2_38_11 TaxID=1817876 RepID=A0A1F7RCK6_9BACT|nr:MAG: hypothetical protein A2042_01310 [Candidatus Schekmanbacteria bacterium GWA2_38_11]
MKAVFITEHGGIDKIKFDEVKKPVISSKEVLIKLKAASLNHLDIWVRQGIPGIKVEFPHILGSDGAGVVEEAGQEVKNVKAGDKVLLNPGISCNTCEFCSAGEHSLCPAFHLLGEHVNGTYAEYVKAPFENVHRIPGNLSFEEAAAFPLVFLTAWRMLISKARLLPGETILILGIGGGVSSAALRIAKHTGARVIVTSGDNNKIEKAKQLGADIAINYNEKDFAKEIRNLTQKRGVDVLLDNIGSVTWIKSLSSLARGGRLVTCGATTGANPQTDIQRIFWNQISVLGSTMGNRKEFLQILNLFEVNNLKPVIDSVFLLKDFREAQKKMEEKKQFGKIVIKIY